MTATGFLVGVLAGIGVLALVTGVALFFAVRRIIRLTKEGQLIPAHGPQTAGFAEFRSRARSLLADAPVHSNVSAKLPIPPVELLLRVAGRAAGKPSYRLEIRMGYKRLDHLALVEAELARQPIGFERTDKGNGLIKLVSDKVDTVDPLLEISDAVRRLVTFDLEDGKIEVLQSLRASK